MCQMTHQTSDRIIHWKRLSIHTITTKINRRHSVFRRPIHRVKTRLIYTGYDHKITRISIRNPNVAFAISNLKLPCQNLFGAITHPIKQRNFWNTLRCMIAIMWILRYWWYHFAYSYVNGPDTLVKNNICQKFLYFLFWGGKLVTFFCERKWWRHIWKWDDTTICCCKFKLSHIENVFQWRLLSWGNWCDMIIIDLLNTIFKWSSKLYNGYIMRLNL